MASHRPPAASFGSGPNGRASRHTAAVVAAAAAANAAGMPPSGLQSPPATTPIKTKGGKRASAPSAASAVNAAEDPPPLVAGSASKVGPAAVPAAAAVGAPSAYLSPLSCCCFCSGAVDRTCEYGVVWLGPYPPPPAAPGQLAGPPLVCHASCAKWCKEVRVSETGDAKEKQVLTAIQRISTSKCAHCDKLGGTVSCYSAKCPLSYHVSCLRAAGGVLVGNYCAAYCQQHARKADTHKGKDLIFQVERILCARMRGTKRQFLIKWQGYELPTDSTWEPAESFLHSVLINQFDAECAVKANSTTAPQITEEKDQTAAALQVSAPASAPAATPAATPMPSPIPASAHVPTPNVIADVQAEEKPAGGSLRKTPRKNTRSIGAPGPSTSPPIRRKSAAAAAAATAPVVVPVTTTPPVPAAATAPPRKAAVVTPAATISSVIAPAPLPADAIPPTAFIHPPVFAPIMPHHSNAPMTMNVPLIPEVKQQHLASVSEVVPLPTQLQGASLNARSSSRPITPVTSSISSPMFAPVAPGAPIVPASASPPPPPVTRAPPARGALSFSREVKRLTIFNELPQLDEQPSLKAISERQAHPSLAVARAQQLMVSNATQSTTPGRKKRERTATSRHLQSDAKGGDDDGDGDDEEGEAEPGHGDPRDRFVVTLGRSSSQFGDSYRFKGYRVHAPSPPLKMAPRTPQRRRKSVPQTRDMEDVAPEEPAPVVRNRVQSKAAAAAEYLAMEQDEETSSDPMSDVDAPPAETRAPTEALGARSDSRFHNAQQEQPTMVNATATANPPRRSSMSMSQASASPKMRSNRPPAHASTPSRLLLSPSRTSNSRSPPLSARTESAPNSLLALALAVHTSDSSASEPVATKSSVSQSSVPPPLQPHPLQAQPHPPSQPHPLQQQAASMPISAVIIQDFAQPQLPPQFEPMTFTTQGGVGMMDTSGGGGYNPLLDVTSQEYSNWYWSQGPGIAAGHPSWTSTYPPNHPVHLQMMDGTSMGNQVLGFTQGHLQSSIASPMFKSEPTSMDNGLGYFSQQSPDLYGSASAGFNAPVTFSAPTFDFNNYASAPFTSSPAYPQYTSFDLYGQQAMPLFGNGMQSTMHQTTMQYTNNAAFKHQHVMSTGDSRRGQAAPFTNFAPLPPAAAAPTQAALAIAYFEKANLLTPSGGPTSSTVSPTLTATPVPTRPIGVKSEGVKAEPPPADSSSATGAHQPPPSTGDVPIATASSPSAILQPITVVDAAPAAAPSSPHLPVAAATSPFNGHSVAVTGTAISLPAPPTVADAAAVIAAAAAVAEAAVAAVAAMAVAAPPPPPAPVVAPISTSAPPPPPAQPSTQLLAESQPPAPTAQPLTQTPAQLPVESASPPPAQPLEQPAQPAHPLADPPAQPLAPASAPASLSSKLSPALEPLSDIPVNSIDSFSW